MPTFSPDPGIQTCRHIPRALDARSLANVLNDLVKFEKITRNDANIIYHTCLSKPKGVSKRKTLGDQLETIGGRELRDEAWKRLR